MKAIFSFFVLPLTLLEITFAGEKKKQPNIIFLFADDQNLGSVGIYGNPEVKTPNMDQLGRDGLIFDRHYNTTAICMASRANVMTGLYEYRTGTNFNHGDMTQEIWSKSYPVLLRKNGYLTAFAGKFGFKVEGHGYECGSFFDMWGGSPGQTDYRTAKNKSMAKYAEEFPHSTLSYAAFSRDVIQKAVKDNKPFCLSVSFKAPHRPVQPDPKFDHVYKGKTFTKPKNYGREAGAHRPVQSRMGRQYPRFEEWGYHDNYDEVMAKYYQQIYAIDVALGMIREELKKQDVADNTVIIYTSDNGFLCGVHGYGSKVLPFEDSARVPLMIYDPRSKTAGKGLRSAALTGNIDFAPTIFELAGLAIPAGLDGVSLLPLLEAPSKDIRQQMAFINVFGNKGGTTCLSALTKTHKYTYWWYGDGKLEPAEELYDLVKDPLEQTNLALAPSSKALLKSMQKRYDLEHKKWKQSAVSSAYRPYATLFDRHIPLDQKQVKNPKVRKR